MGASHAQMGTTTPQSPASADQLPPHLLPAHLRLTGCHIGLGREKGKEKTAVQGKGVAWCPQPSENGQWG